MANNTTKRRVDISYEFKFKQFAELKVIGIRPMAPVLNTGPLEGI